MSVDHRKNMIAQTIAMTAFLKGMDLSTGPDQEVRRPLIKNARPAQPKGQKKARAKVKAARAQRRKQRKKK